MQLALRRARELKRTMRGGLSPADELSWLAVSVGDFDTAIGQTRETNFENGDAASQSFVAAALLARGQKSGSTTDLLDAAEMLSRIEGDVAAACNRVVLWEYLGLSYRAKELSAQCPLLDAAPISFAADRWSGAVVSASDLPTTERAAVLQLMDQGDTTAAVARIRTRAQAWRVFFEREALVEWVTVAGDFAPRTQHEGQIRRLAEAYREASGNPAPSRLIDDLAAVSSADLERTEAAINSWLKGARLLTAYNGEASGRSLRLAREQAAGLLPTLLPAIDVTAAGAHYHMGDLAGVRARAQALTSSLDVADFPWVVGRALMVETVGLLGAAEWEAVLRTADRSEEILERIGEHTQAAYVAMYKSWALAAFNEPGPAQEAIVTSIRRLIPLDDTRTLAGSQILLARFLGSYQRPFFGVEVQLEGLHNYRRLGDATTIAECETVLAEQLRLTGNLHAARAAAATARRTAETILGAAARARELSVIDLLEADLGAMDSPEDAVAGLDRFLETFEQHGLRYRKAEAHLARGRALIHLGLIEDATVDLGIAIDEASDQSLRLKDPVRSAALLDSARQVTESLVEATLLLEPAGHTALELVERMRLLQQARALGYEPPRIGPVLPRLPRDTCAVEYFLLPSELLAWSYCGGGSAILRRTPTTPREISFLAATFKAAARTGDLPRLRRSSREISQVLIAPILDIVGKAANLVIIPDALYGEIPLAWLTREDDFLLRDQIVMTAPSLSSLQILRPPTDGLRILAFGDPRSVDTDLAPLPEAVAEVAELARQPHAGAATGVHATLQRLTTHPGNFNTFHYAGHVDGGAATSLTSRMLFGPDKDHPDGRVALQEIAHMRLGSFRLAVLAACSSANSGTTRLAGSIGFAHAFSRAGVRDVVGTLWPVADGDQRAIVREYFALLGTGAQPREALHELWRQELDTDKPRPERLAVLAAMQLLTTTTTDTEGVS